MGKGGGGEELEEALTVPLDPGQLQLDLPPKALSPLCSSLLQGPRGVLLLQKGREPPGVGRTCARPNRAEHRSPGTSPLQGSQGKCHLPSAVMSVREEGPLRNW